MKSAKEITVDILRAIDYPVEITEHNKMFFNRQRIESIIKNRDMELLQIRFCDLYNSIIKE